MSNFEKVTSSFLILIGLSESLIHTPSVPSFIVLEREATKSRFVFFFGGGRFELMSKKKKSKERKALSFGAILEKELLLLLSKTAMQIKLVSVSTQH